MVAVVFVVVVLVVVLVIVAAVVTRLCCFHFISEFSKAKPGTTEELLLMI